MNNNEFEKIDIYCMKQAIKEANKAYKKNEIPVGAVLYSKRKGKVISRSYNKKESSNLVISHAEINVITKANKKEKNWRLIDTILYTTLEPCDMCKEVIREAKISRVVYGAKSRNEQNCGFFFQVANEMIVNECEKLIKNKFLEIRDQ